ncbi:MAG: hypothetical protein F6K55_12440 [Moorea sp. SIO4A3]|nr:hypothetical protein [Moorena sp. SIO4A3]
MSSISELAIAYIKGYKNQTFENYTNLLTEACHIQYPPHAMPWRGNLYRQFARNREWFGDSSYTEPNGSV